MKAALLRLHSNGSLALLLLVVLAVVAAGTTSPDYGLSWDEPYFYAYADAVPYAYSVQARLDGDFDLERAYGPSATDHKVYGPAYLLLAKPLVDLVQGLSGSDRASTWHFINSLTFLLSIVFLFKLCRRWISPWPAFSAAVLYGLQPMLWGHGFVNPKDIPFLAFFLAAVTLGLAMVDRVLSPEATAIEARRISQPEAGPVPAGSGALRMAPSRARASAWAALGIGALALAGWISGRSASWLERLLAPVALAAGVGLPGSGMGGGGLRRWIARHASWIEPLPTWPGLLPPRGRLSYEIRAAILPGVVLGIASCIRILGPAAGVLVLTAFLLQARRRSMLGIVVYGITAAATVYLSWPYLWDSPLTRLWEVVQRSAQNPTSLGVLFQGGLYHANALPRIYFPLLLGVTLTEPTLILAAVGLALSLVGVVRRAIDWRTFVVIPLWFFAFFSYIVLAKPPMYDGIRHFLFILPPLFVLAGFAFQAIFSSLRWEWARAALVLLLVLPGVYGIVETHPYEYAYYNQFVGRLSGAFRRFETDYWLTCYKDAMARFNAAYASQSPALYVFREPYIAGAYASSSVQVKQLEPDRLQARPGDFLLLSSRTNEDRYFAESPAVIVVGKGGATFCVIRQVPEPGLASD